MVLRNLISDDTKRVVIIDEPGQLCNQLWAYSPIIGFLTQRRKYLLTIYGFQDLSKAIH